MRTFILHNTSHLQKITNIIILFLFQFAFIIDTSVLFIPQRLTRKRGSPQFITFLFLKYNFSLPGLSQIALEFFFNFLSLQSTTDHTH